MRSAARLAIVPFLLALPWTAGCSLADAGDEVDELNDDDIAAWNDAYEENASGKTDSAGCSGVVVPDRGGFNKRIALTFDDGPNLNNTPQVLEVLAAHNATGTFFINGKNVRSEEHRALLRQMRDAGHIVGNHSQNHENLKTLSASRLKTEVEATHQVLLDLDINPSYFRFPFGSSSCASADTVRSYGYAITGWHIDSADWCYGSSRGGVGYCDPATFQYVPDSYRSDLGGFVLSQARSTGGGVLLFHDSHAYTVSVLDNVLTKLENDGFKFVGLDETETFPLLNGVKPADGPFVGSTCTDSSQCKFSGSGQDGFCQSFEGGGFCSLSCDGYCPDKYGSAATFCVSLDGETGQCVSKSAAENNQCADLPGTSAQAMDRFIGTSGASASSAVVCVP